MNQLILPASVKANIPTAKIPVQYEQACKALAACESIDEAKEWDTKADALAAWARIYKSDQAAAQARSLKLYAYRRMGKLSAELRPRYRMVKEKGEDRARGSLPGPRSALMELGLNNRETQQIRRIANLPEKTFEKLATMERPPSPAHIYNRLTVPGTDAWKKIAASGGGCIMIFRSFCRTNSDAAALARGLSADEARMARAMVRECSDWLDNFEQHLPKAI
jgi:hypothetical protein